MATIGASIPCIELPNPKPLKISLPFGGDLKSVIDISKGPPSDCTLIHGLMLQLAPALASMECFLKVLKVVQAMANISVTSLPDIAKAVGEMVACFNVFAKIPCMIVDVLKVIIAYLKCIIEAVESIFKFQIGINFGAAAGNPVLLASLNCAQNNANASTAQLKEALALVKPIGDMAPSLPGPVGDALKIIPDALASIGQVLDGGSVSAGVPGGADVVAKLDEVKTVLKQVEDALDLVPC